MFHSSLYPYPLVYQQVINVVREMDGWDDGHNNGIDGWIGLLNYCFTNERSTCDSDGLY